MHGQGPYRSDQAACPGMAISKFTVCSLLDLVPVVIDRHSRRLVGALSRVVDYNLERSPLHCGPIPSLGDDESLSVAEHWEGHNLSIGKRRRWKRSWGGSSGNHNATGCLKDSNDACKGEDGCLDNADHDSEGERA